MYKHPPELLAAWSEAENAVSKAVEALIRAELEAMRPELEAAEEAAAERLRVALLNLEPAEMFLAENDAEIAHAEEKAAEWRVKLEGGNVDERMEARKWLAAFDEEMESLIAKREAITEAMAPHVKERNKAREALKDAQAELRGLDLNILIPYFGRGQLTSAYRLFRVDMGHLVPIILAGAPVHAEWGPAMELMDSLCMASGYRTDHLPDDAMQQAKAWDELLADKLRESPAPAPTGADAMAITRMHVEAEANSGGHDLIEDYRNPAARAYMQVSRLSGDMRRH